MQPWYEAQEIARRTGRQNDAAFVRNIAALSCLQRLQRLNNTDKHRQISMMFLGPDRVGSDSDEPEFPHEFNEDEITDGAEIGRYICAETVRTTEWIDIHATLRIVLVEPGLTGTHRRAPPVQRLLAELIDEIAGILNLLEHPCVTTPVMRHGRGVTGRPLLDALPPMGPSRRGPRRTRQLAGTGT